MNNHIKSPMFKNNYHTGAINEILINLKQRSNNNKKNNGGTFESHTGAPIYRI